MAQKIPKVLKNTNYGHTAHDTEVVGSSHGEDYVALYPWARYLTFLCFSRLSCKMSTSDAVKLTCDGLASYLGEEKLLSA